MNTRSPSARLEYLSTCPPRALTRSTTIFNGELQAGSAWVGNGFSSVTQDFLGVELQGADPVEIAERLFLGAR